MKPITIRLCVILLWGIGWPIATCSAAFVYVNGQGSDTIFRFDLTTGAGTLVGTYPAGYDPRNLAIDPAGVLYSSLNGGNLNIVKLVPQSGGLLGPVNFTASIGNFGPGQIQFYKGGLYAAGDGSRTIFDYNPVTGSLIRSFSVTTSANIRGMTIADDRLYYAEIFQSRIRQHDLTQIPPPGSTLVQDTTNLLEPYNMAIGHDGNLYITNRASTKVQKIDHLTGAFLGTFVDLSSINPALSGGWDIAYSASLNNYFVTAGDALYRFNTSGLLLNTYTNPGLTTATGIAVPLPEPGTLSLAGFGFVGLWVAYRRRKRTRSCSFVM